MTDSVNLEVEAPSAEPLDDVVGSEREHGLESVALKGPRKFE